MKATAIDHLRDPQCPIAIIGLGYVERINPGDPVHRLTNIKKVTSGSTPEVAALVDGLYREIISAGTHRASSIRVAEAAKVIENTQRDLNIALILGVAHRDFLDLGEEGLRRLGKSPSVLYDVKSVLPKGASDARL